jgi:SAM-dependent methyltransferase
MDFGDVEYWERFYRRFLPNSQQALLAGSDEAPCARGEGAGQLEQYEWYFEASALVPRLLPCLRALAAAGREPLTALMLGCGSSRLSELLYAAGYHHITNVDFSPLVIASMRERTCASCPQLQWLVADVTNMHALASAR